MEQLNYGKVQDVLEEGPYDMGQVYEEVGEERYEKKNNKVYIPAIGSLGDILPFVALGVKLLERGYEVRIGTATKYEMLVRGHGIDWVEILGDLDDELRIQAQTSSFGGLTGSGQTNMKDILQPLMSIWFKSIAATSADCDLIVLTYSSLLAGFSLLEARPELCVVVVYTFPCSPTKHYAPTLSGSSVSLFSFINSVKWAVVDFSMWRMWKEFINQLRLEVYQLPPVSGNFRDHFRAIRSTPMPFITAYSKWLYPKPSDWSVNEYLVGPITYHNNRQIEDFVPPQDLFDFLQDEDDKPIYFGLGNMLGTGLSMEDQNHMIECLEKALRLTDLRGIISTKGVVDTERFSNNPTSNPYDRQSHVYYFKYFIPHAWLFPQCKAAIHHGGAGTVHTSLRFSLPTLIIPFGLDQSFNGDRVYQLGLGPQPIPVKKVTVDSLVAALKKLVRTKKYVEEAKKVGRNMRLENGLERTLGVLEKTIKRGDGHWLKSLKAKYNHEKWMPDTEAVHCCRCRIKFTMLKRRHHCRMCGLVFCTVCCDNFSSIYGIIPKATREPVRLCVECYNIVSSHITEQQMDMDEAPSQPMDPPSYPVDQPSQPVDEPIYTQPVYEEPMQGNPYGALWNANIMPQVEEPVRAEPVMYDGIDVSDIPQITFKGRGAKSSHENLYDAPTGWK